MFLYAQKLNSKNDTPDKIKSIVDKFYSDLDLIFTYNNGELIPVIRLTLEQYYFLLRSIPYRRDPNIPPKEIIARPYYLFKYLKLGLDCKKKSILVAAYLRYKKIPYRFIGSSNRKDKKLHHIFIQGKIDNSWKNIDPTFSYNRLFEPKNECTYMEIF